MQITIDFNKAKVLNLTAIDYLVAVYLSKASLANQRIDNDIDYHAHQLVISKTQFSAAKSNLMALGFIDQSRSQGITISPKLNRALYSEFYTEPIPKDTNVPTRVLEYLGEKRVEKLLSKAVRKPSRGQIADFMKIHRQVRVRLKGQTDDWYVDFYIAYIEYMFSLWYTEKMKRYLRATTLFGSTSKFFNRIDEMQNQ